MKVRLLILAWGLCAAPWVIGQEISAYQLGRRMAFVERRLSDLQYAKPTGATEADLAAVRAELVALERQTVRLSPQDMAQYRRDLTSLEARLMGLSAPRRTPYSSWGAPTPSSEVAMPAAFVKQIGQEQFRVTVTGPGRWYDSRLPYAGNCYYEIKRTIHQGKYEVTAGSKVHWYDAGTVNPQVLDLGEAGTIKIRINDESAESAMTFEVSRRLPAIGYCYGPVFEPLGEGRTMCDIEYPMYGDSTPPITRGLNEIAPLFGEQPTKPALKRAYNPGCPPGSPGGPPPK